MVTGATGFIGANLCHALANKGYIVHALYRSEEKAKAIQHPNITLFRGNILDNASMENAIKGCEFVFHLAAYAQVWAKSNQTFYELNYKATENLFKLALTYDVKRVVFTSTAGTIGPSLNGRVDEGTTRDTGFFSEYERTKHLAEELAREYSSKGLEVITVNPTRVYGPGELSVSNSVTKMIKQYVHGKFRFLPGNGKSIGNYVFIDDVVRGHLQALERGKPAERYILGGNNISYVEFFELLSDVSGKKNKMYLLPLSWMLVIANMMLVASKLTGIKPLITPGWVRKFNHHWNVSSKKAQNQLNYNPVPLREGLKKTVNWINDKPA